MNFLGERCHTNWHRNRPQNCDLLRPYSQSTINSRFTKNQLGAAIAPNEGVFNDPHKIRISVRNSFFVDHIDGARIAGAIRRPSQRLGRARHSPRSAHQH
jgi:hypothetical protein